MPHVSAAEILAMGVHDTKNKLFAVQSLLAKGSLEDCQAASRLVAEASGRLTRMLDAYKAQRHQLMPVFQHLRVLEMLEDVLLALPPGLPEHLRIAGDCSEALMWVLDRDLIAEALLNAVSNACRFAATEVLVTAQVDEDWLCLSVFDDGPGYPEPVSQTPGEGFGLQLSAQVARLHKAGLVAGYQRLSNRAQGGACFQLFIPRGVHV